MNNEDSILGPKSGRIWIKIFDVEYVQMRINEYLC